MVVGKVLFQDLLTKDESNAIRLYVGGYQDLLDHLENCFNKKRGTILISLNSYTAYLLGTKVLNFNNSCLFVIDGMPLDYLLRIRRVYNSSKLIPGSDFGELFVSSSLQSRRILLIGGTNEASEIVANKMRTVGHFVVRYFEDIEIENLDSHSKYLSGLIRADNLDTIICCLGQPKQERLALKLLERNSSVTILCLGAFIDFYSQNKPRAPLLYRKFGIEWLWRLAHEPKRLWIRYAVKSPIGLILFFKYR